ncbi:MULTISPECIES: enoyl-CoA hydratase/isomerase family protein [unclassified Paludibacterium]|uniref:enoyl-CoA hydratase/isomerase family protein n=1 Tax=unclassified Paludibacterium TaxID=2618429 RepID=UPI001C04AB9A|nr:enoyl-CoA hydratase/isomerase family protein [Paludibacterium sp. B53371]BEV70717.1 enoyl-CoA hydratase/isomerase family protein [Paludibacterium sp. THUN1379]
MNPVEFSTLPCGAGQQLGIATLNSEKSLNALTLPMIRALDRQLIAWQHDAAVVGVVLRGAGDKAFCAGGDVRALRQALIDRPGNAPHPDAESFFSEEYTLDYRIHCYPKPLIVWGSGIVMGGGLGLLAGASHRVLTATSRIAMPEITIGLYPDVGGSWFLSRMPARVGLFLALTGAPVNAADALWLNLGDHILAAGAFDSMLDRLVSAPWPADPRDHKAYVSQLLGAMEDHPALDSPVQRHFDTIRRLMNQGTLQDVRQSLECASFDDPWLAKAREGFLHGCPTSAALSWEIERRTAHQSLADVLRMELTLSVNVCARSEFVEGVRALLVDKDRQPRWSHSWSQLSHDWIDSHFDSPWPDNAHPLRQLGH